MKKIKFIVFAVALATMLQFNAVYAQTSTFDQVHLFQTFFEDASMSRTPYGQISLRYSDYDQLSSIYLPVQAAIPLGDQKEFQLGAELGFINTNPEIGDGESGLSDLKVIGRYNFPTSSYTKIAAGGYITLPVGKEEAGYGNVNFGGFGSVRHPLTKDVVLTGTVMLEFLESVNDDRESSLLFAVGSIYQVSPKMYLIGELNLKTEGDYGLLSAGMDYRLSPDGCFRGMLGFGLDDGAPDLALQVGYHMFFN
ncbi:hypothetical protein Ctha_0425 [Chloroherpeton thalassium ATCC 35110]|uniref:Transporter n=1 Tax=Chloroherpeton thalassium (strain ATCC 35110 / GB-78) TaxID=517418 RepID=B3QUJ0_CHLT3|nr:hypothetical protein [Chloroherpeton thalassium]ACF12896.1 hypothetical protein Ctha_0425 [Chloroherpeton thalassium ATCC 35110]